MRTTLDLPDDLLQQAKIAAVQRGTTLRDLVAQALRQDLLLPAAVTQAKPLPQVRVAVDAPILQMTPQQLGALAHQQALDDDTARAG